MIDAVSVAAVVVTYNRCDLLKQTLACLKAQTSAALSQIIVVNGASTDGTKDYLDALADPLITVANLTENRGGAGGFNWGVHLFYEQTDADYVWLMDDDAQPQPMALAKLMTAFATDPAAGWAASRVVWTDGEWSRMNVPAPADNSRDAVYHGTENLVPIKHATFVSTIFSRDLVRHIGLPQKEYFIWGDDIEFTERAHRCSRGLFVRDSVVVHASQLNPHPGDIVGETQEGRLPRYLLEYRNRLLTSRRRGSVLKFLKTLAHGGLDFAKTLFRPGVLFRGRKLVIILRGTWRGFFFRPTVEHVSDHKKGN